jgi:hypothetical protein
LWYDYEVLPVFKKISTNTFLLRKIAHTLGYIAALKTKFENKRMYSRDKQRLTETMERKKRPLLRT